MKLVALLALVVGMLVTPALASAEPQMEVHPGRSRCVVPFEILATGLQPEREVIVDMVVDGVVSGSVGGRSEADGRFFSPIPMVLLPCGPGGMVTANLKLDGAAVVTATFEVAPPVVPPAPPALGDSEAAAPTNDWMFVSAIGAGFLLLTLVLLLVGPRRDGEERRGDANAEPAEQHEVDD